MEELAVLVITYVRIAPAGHQPFERLLPVAHLKIQRNLTAWVIHDKSLPHSRLSVAPVKSISFES
jgi:hypothetical protein